MFSVIARMNDGSHKFRHSCLVNGVARRCYKH
uniref:Uncharacterized protein n=1 Tax=Arundo donax TaxID=35708 RepID=A0A0A8YRR9_ARUDO